MIAIDHREIQVRPGTGIILILVRFISLLFVCLPVWSDSLGIRNVNVIDVESGTVRRGVNVTFNGPIIRAVEENPAPPSRSRLSGFVEGKGKYLIPALWDMHVHLWDEKPRFGMYVANGVLGVRDMGTNLSRTKEWRANVEDAKIIGPRIYTPGSPIDGPGGADNTKMPIVRAGDPDAARRAVDAIDAQGADFIKVLSSVSRDSYFALAQRARVIRAPFAGHVPESVTVWQALDARQKSMEHLLGIALACSTEEPELREARLLASNMQDTAELARIRARTYETFSEARAVELFRRLARFDVWQTPTLTLPRQPRDYEFHQKLVALMQREGVGLLAGTDTGDDGVLPGSALHHELELLVGAGLSPAQALRTATLNPARYFGIAAEAGTIGKGKRADLVLLDANPLEDIRNANKISAVVVRGRVLDRKELDRLLKEGDGRWKDNSPFSKPQPERHSVKRRVTSKKRASHTR